MKRALSILIAMIALPALAADGDQSYVSYDDGETIIRQAYDSREVDARLNLPVFSGDELATGRRGRTEVRLADGNVVAIDHDSSLRFVSIANGYEEEEAQTIVELRQGRAIVHLLEQTDSPLRLDTPMASYVSLSDGIYTVETDPRGRDRISILSGAVEIRTQNRTYRLRAGETAAVDADGLYDIAAAASYESSFDRWYLKRVERYTGQSTQYLDSSLSYAEADLRDNGDWVYVGEYGWVWRPYASAGWRPYYNGSWHYGPRGHKIWYSAEPWGWVPYHYGRWTHHGRYGWVWMPGYAYSPAWVYWTYGPTYIGWSPIGCYSFYRPYSGWYGGWDRHDRYGSVGIGFYGRVKLAGTDLSGWTFLDSGDILSSRVDRAALTMDAVRARFTRDGGDAIFSSSPVRFTRDDAKNPAAAIGRIARGGIGGGTGKEGSGSLADLTPFFRRDPELSPAVRTQIDRANVSDAVKRALVPAPGERTGAAPSTGAGTINRGGIARTLPAAPAAGQTGAGREAIGRSVPAKPAGTIERAPLARPAPATGSRETPRVIASPDGGGTIQRVTPAPVASPTPRAAPAPQKQEEWRGRVVRPAAPSSEPQRSEVEWRAPRPRPASGSTQSGPTAREPETTRAPIPRQVIDRIGGARMVPSRDSSSTTRDSGERAETPRSSAPSTRGSVSRPSSTPRSPSVSRPSPAPSSSRGSVSRSSSGSSSSRPSSPSRGGSVSRSAPSSDSGSASKSSSGSSGGSSRTIRKD